MTTKSQPNPEPPATIRELTSPRSSRVKDIRRLAKRTFRYRGRRFLVEGSQSIREALDSSDRLVELFATAEAENRHADLIERARSRGVPTCRVSREIMAELGQTVTPQGLVGTCRFLDVPLEAVTARKPALVAVLAYVRDPGNAGTVLRAADAAGADAVVFTDASVDPYNGKCVRASAGSLFHLPVVVGVPVAEAIDALRGAGLTVLAAGGEAERSLDDAFDDGTLASPSAWVFGNEAWGLPAHALHAADAGLKVPIHGQAESLNLATAAAVCLYASARAHRRPAGGRDNDPRRS